MKKLILSLFIFFSVISQAQIQIPQVVGLPAALSGKEAKLPSTPSSPESKFLNGNRQWAEIVLGSGGYASNVYFTNLASTIVGTYRQTSGTHELTETIASGTCNNNEVLIHTYLFEQPVGITTIDAGVWRFTMNCAINSNVGDSKFKIVQYKRSDVGVETDMFTIYSNTIENTDYQNFIIETIQPSFEVSSTDRLGCRVYATTTTTVNKTISYKVGDGFASYLNTPLALRHDQNRDKNGNPLYQHLTSAQVSKVDATSGTNTGDETLTSIKTKLGAATSVSDGYLKYQDWNLFNSKEPAITKNTGFNKNFGTTAGTVLEGRTFGTAANSAVGDFVQNQNSSAQSANMWINGIIKTVNPVAGWSGWLENTAVGGSGLVITASDASGGLPLLVRKKDATEVFSINNTGAATFSSTVNSTGFLLNGNNLTSSLTTNYIPKWNGSSMVNSLISDDGTVVKLGNSASTHLRMTSNGVNGYNVNSRGDFYLNYEGANTFLGNDLSTSTTYVLATTPSTSPTTGALVVGGGVGANHVRANNFYGNGSNLTGVQLPITLTTNGTSGAATFSGNVLNVPNYAASGGVNQTQTTVNGSVNGNAICSMPFQTSTYKKVIILLGSFSGSLTYTFPTPFLFSPNIYTGAPGISPATYSITTTSLTLSGGSNTNGWVTLEGF